MVYDPKTVDLNLLLDLYFKTIDPTSLNQQGNDRGTQYRTGIYYVDKEDLPVIKQAIQLLSAQYKTPIVLEVKPLTNFYPAETYHQDYLDKNPGGYCHINPALFEMARKANAPKAKAYQKADDATLRKELSAEQYAVTQKRMPLNLLSTINTGMSIVPAFMWILLPENLCLSLPTSLIQVAGGQAFSQPIQKRSNRRKERYFARHDTYGSTQ